MSSPGKIYLVVAPLLFVVPLLSSTAASAYTIEALASAFPVGHPDGVSIGTTTSDTSTTQLFFDTGVVTSTFGTRLGDPPNTAQGLARASVTSNPQNAFELGVLASSTGDNLVAGAGARARIMDQLVISLPAGTPSAALGVTFTITGFDQNDGGLINGFLGSISVGTLTDLRGVAWGPADLSPDPFTGEIVPLIFSGTFTVSDGDLLLLSAAIDARTDGSRTLDFSSTGGVSFALPPGGSLLSETGITIIPEPGTLLLIGLGLAGFAVTRRSDRGRISRRPRG